MPVEYNKDLKLYEIKYKGYTFTGATKDSCLDTYRQCVKLWDIK